MACEHKEGGGFYHPRRPNRLRLIYWSSGCIRSLKRLMKIATRGATAFGGRPSRRPWKSFWNARTSNRVLRGCVVRTAGTNSSLPSPVAGAVFVPVACLPKPLPVRVPTQTGRRAGRPSEAGLADGALGKPGGLRAVPHRQKQIPISNIMVENRRTQYTKQRRGMLVETECSSPSPPSDGEGVGERWSVLSAATLPMNPRLGARREKKFGVVSPRSSRGEEEEPQRSPVGFLPEKVFSKANFVIQRQFPISYPLTETENAFAALRSRKVLGEVVIEPFEPVSESD